MKNRTTLRREERDIKRQTHAVNVERKSMIITDEEIKEYVGALTDPSWIINKVQGYINCPCGASHRITKTRMNYYQVNCPIYGVSVKTKSRRSMVAKYVAKVCTFLTISKVVPI